MNIRFPLIVSAVLIAAMVAAGAYVWTLLPPHALVPVHWDIAGKTDRYAEKSFALFYLPATLAALSALFAWLPRLEPRRSNLLSSGKFYRATWIGLALLLAAVHAAALAAALRLPVNIGIVVVVAVALLFAVIGNYLGKTRSNFFAGVRTPWTLASDYSWERTHRLAGRLFILSSAASLATMIATTTKAALIVLVGLILASSLAAVVMSYVYWARDPDRSPGNGATR